MSQRFALTGMIINLMLFLLICPQNSQAQGRASAQFESDLKQEIQADLLNAIELLKAGKFLEFTIMYQPIEDVRALQAGNRRQLILTEQNANKIIAYLEKFKSASIEMVSNYLVAELTWNVKETDSIPPAIKLQQPEFNNQETHPGYGSDLNTALKSALADLKKKDLISFGQKMLPLHQRAHWEKVGWKKFERTLSTQTSLLGNEHEGMLQTANRLTVPMKLASPVEILITDFEQLISLEPAFVDTPILSVFFTIPTPPTTFPKPNTYHLVSFELVNGNWRMQDSSREMRQQIESNLMLPTRRELFFQTIKMEKIGQNWRFVTSPF